MSELIVYIQDYLNKIKQGYYDVNNKQIFDLILYHSIRLNDEILYNKLINGRTGNKFSR